MKLPSFRKFFVCMIGCAALASYWGPLGAIVGLQVGMLISLVI